MEGLTALETGVSSADDYAEATRLIRSGVSRSAFDETSEAIFLTSGYVYATAAEAAAAFAGESDRYIYSRYGNPTVGMFEERLRDLEGAEACMATASGMAAVFASLLSHLKAGDRVVASSALFGACYQIIAGILPRLGIETELIDGTDLAQWEAALDREAAAVFLETPSNPGLDIVDIPAVSTLAHAAGARVIVDNVFATPVLQKPLELGADIVVYSATKHIDGQGRAMGGAVLGSSAFVDDELLPFIRSTGPSLSPFNAWVMLKGLETLRLRVDAQSDNARTIADALEGHERITSVRYPTNPSHPQHELARRQMSGGGTVVTFTVDGSQADAFGVLDALQLFDISNNLGDTKSLACHPASTIHSRISAEARAELGITDGLIRLSVGLEDPADLMADLDSALSSL